MIEEKKAVARVTPHAERIGALVLQVNARLDGGRSYTKNVTRPVIILNSGFAGTTPSFPTRLVVSALNPKE